MVIIAHHFGMLVAAWVALGLLGLSILAKLAVSLQGGTQIGAVTDTVTRPVLMSAVPLIILSWLTMVDPTHIVAMFWYYLASVLIAVRSLLEIFQALKR